MTFISRLMLSAPFILALVTYLIFGSAALGNDAIDPFWQNHAMRETIFALIICGVVLNLIWSKVTPGKLMLIAVFGAPFILAFWVADALVGFGSSPIAEIEYINNLLQVILFVVGFIMALTTAPLKAGV